MLIPDRPSAVLLDLDGTVTDSASSVIASLLAALDLLGVPAPADEALMSVVGPPLAWSFEHVAGVAPVDLERAQEAYRTHYAAGSLLDADVVPGMRELLGSLREAGVPVALATSKSVEFAVRILEHHRLTELFTAICGARDRGRRSDKALVISEALESLARAGADLSRVVMVGDREHDTAGAAVHRIPCVLVRWGYGTAEEHAGADAVVGTPEELARLLGVPIPVAGGVS